MSLTELGRRQLLTGCLSTSERIARRLDGLRHQLDIIQSEIDDLVAAKSAVDFLISELEASPPSPAQDAQST